jgi:hypothetical protein
MPRAIVIGALAAALLAAPADAARTATPSFAFGRAGGNIRPYSVTILPTGRVVPTGVRAGNPAVSQATLRSLVGLAAAARLSTMPSLTICPQTLPDFAASWIRIGAKRVAVRGACRPAFSRLYASLARAAGLPA